MYLKHTKYQKYLVFTVTLVAIAGAALAAMELTVLSQNQQEADAKGCSPGLTGYNASQGKCFKPDLQAENTEADGTADEEEEEDNDDNDDE